MSDARPNRAFLPALEASINVMRAKRERGDLRSEILVSGLSVLNLAKRAYALGVFEPHKARMLAELVEQLADALPASPDDRREVRA